MMFSVVVMGDVEQAHALNVLHTDNRILVVVVAAIVLTTSSALIYRTKHLPIPGVLMREDSGLNATLSGLHLADPPPGEHDLDTQPAQKNGEERANIGELSPNNNDEAVRDAKSSRSKERRRRGKDPLKEIMKGGKKSKGFLKPSRPNTGDTDGSGSRSVSQAVELDTPQGSDRSYTRSSSSSDERSKMVSQSPTDTPERQAHADVERQTEALLTTTTSRLQPSPSVVSEFTNFQENMSNTPLPSPADPISTSVLTLDNSSTLTSDHPHDALHIHPSQSLPYFENRRSNKPSSQTFHGPWDWDGQLSPNPSSNNDTNYRKPPRFRSKSRVNNPGSESPMPASKSYSIPFGASVRYSPVSNVSTLSSPSISLSPIPSPEGCLPSFTFPTLNSPSPSPSPGPSSSSNAIQHAYVNTSPGQTSRRMPTPLRTPTGSTESSSSLSLSTQTQIASLKGALEAARMREEKFRLDAERYSKECEMLKWKWGEETVAWRHTQAELQSQVIHLLHQLQGYVSAFTPSSNSPAHLQVSNSNQPFPSHHLHSPSPQQPPHLHPPRSHSPFFAYQGQNPNQQLSQSNMPSLFPGAGPSSASGSSSVESTSPQLDSFPFWDRGRRRTRTMRNGDVDEDWLVPDVHGDLDYRPSADEERDFSDVLADAILKRPESIRVRARPERQESEFTFPSISNLGNVDKNKEAGRGSAGETDLPQNTISTRNGASSGEEPH